MEEISKTSVEDVLTDSSGAASKLVEVFTGVSREQFEIEVGMKPYPVISSRQDEAQQAFVRQGLVPVEGQPQWCGQRFWLRGETGELVRALLLSTEHPFGLSSSSSPGAKLVHALRVVQKELERAQREHELARTLEEAHPELYRSIYGRALLGARRVEELSTRLAIWNAR